MTLPNADDPRGGIPMNTDDEQYQKIMQILEYNVGNEISDDDHKDITRDIMQLLHKSNLQRAIEELKKAAGHNNSEYTSDYLEARIKALQAELQQVGKGEV